MTFTKEDIEQIDVDNSYDYMFPDECIDPVCSVMLSVPEEWKEKACTFFGVDYEDVCNNGWVDVYGYIDPINENVVSIFFEITPNDEDIFDGKERELKISITNAPEMDMLFKQLAKTDGFMEFIKECKKEIEKEED